MRILFLFLDGVGLGQDDPQTNPFARAHSPNILKLTGGARLIADSVVGGPVSTQFACLMALDARMGVSGLPQSATGQASLLTGKNVPAMLGYHYGPKPNPDIRLVLEEKSIFQVLQSANLRSGLLNAFPPGYFRGVDSGLRLPGAIAMAARAAGVKLRDIADLIAGRALAADFTGQGYRDHLHILEAPILEPHQAGHQLASLMSDLDFGIFEYWLSDVNGHRRDMPAACQQIETIDAVLGGLIERWDNEQGLILMTSDHGNLEDLSTRRHTFNPVPALVIGAPALRHEFCQRIGSLADIAPAISKAFGLPGGDSSTSLPSPSAAP